MNTLKTIDPDRVGLKSVAMMPYEEKLPCQEDYCDGFLVATGEANMTNPPIFFHVCNSCGAPARVRGASFPRTVFRPL